MHILIIIGTRPEAIKLAPLIKVLEKLVKVSVCVTAQHREMLDQVLSLFDIQPHYDLNLMQENQSLADLTANLCLKLPKVFQTCRPDLVIVQGDTTTSMAAALVAFYEKIKVAHVEAGLRTYNLQAPYPEEANRQITTRLSHYHFAPTSQAKNNLLNEGVLEEQIMVTGNTVIDALHWILNNRPVDRKALIDIDKEKKLILVTGHRRENFGQRFEQICMALRKIAQTIPEAEIVYPVHLNPNVRKPVHALLSRIANIRLIEPLAYDHFAHLMQAAYLILTDSGGIQEEAPSLNKPVLVMRDTTERPEGLAANAVKLVGCQADSIYEHVARLFKSDEDYQSMANAHNPYGDGQACQRIALALLEDKCLINL